MAHIQLKRSKGSGQLIIDGVDVTHTVFADVRLVEVGHVPEFAEVGLQVTFAVSRLDLDNDTDVQVTDRLPVVAQRVRSMTKSTPDDVVEAGL